MDLHLHTIDRQLAGFQLGPGMSGNALPDGHNVRFPYNNGPGGNNPPVPPSGDGGSRRSSPVHNNNMMNPWHHISDDKDNEGLQQELANYLEVELTPSKGGKRPGFDSFSQPSSGASTIKPTATTTTTPPAPNPYNSYSSMSYPFGMGVNADPFASGNMGTASNYHLSAMGYSTPATTDVPIPKTFVTKSMPRYATIILKDGSVARFLAPFRVTVNDIVIVEAQGGESIGSIVQISTDIPPAPVAYKIVRRATPMEMQYYGESTGATVNSGAALWTASNNALNTTQSTGGVGTCVGTRGQLPQSQVQQQWRNTMAPSESGSLDGGGMSAQTSQVQPSTQQPSSLLSAAQLAQQQQQQQDKLFTPYPRRYGEEGFSGPTNGSTAPSSAALATNVPANYGDVETTVAPTTNNAGVLATTSESPGASVTADESKILAAPLYAKVAFKHDSSKFLAPFRVNVGDYVVIEGDRGEAFGTITTVTAEAPSEPVNAKIIRHALPEDVQSYREKLKEEDAATRNIQQIATRVRLNAHVVDVEYQFDRNKLTVFVERSDPRVFVSFRRLQRELFTEYRCRIWLAYMDEINPDGSHTAPVGPVNREVAASSSIGAASKGSKTNSPPPEESSDRDRIRNRRGSANNKFSYNDDPSRSSGSRKSSGGYTRGSISVPGRKNSDYEVRRDVGGRFNSRPSDNAGRRTGGGSGVSVHQQDNSDSRGGSSRYEWMGGGIESQEEKAAIIGIIGATKKKRL